MPRAKPDKVTLTKLDLELAQAVAEFYADPLGYVMFVFPWDTDPSIQMVELKEPWASRFGCKYGPDEWACKFLDNLGKEIRKRKFDGKNAVPPIQFSTASGHGIGKSAMVAWLIKFIMDTRPYCQGTVTANTAEQLRTKTWAELGKWNKKSLTGHLYVYTTGRGAMSFYRKGYKEEWKCSAYTAREENSESFAGQHAANSTSFYIFDEGSGIPSKIFDVREGGTTDGEPMTFDFGNPTRNSGRFFDNTFGKFKHRYNVVAVDSRTVAITNKDRINQWIQDYGIESDFVKVRVLGEAPSSGTLQFIPSGDVEAAMMRPTPNGGPLVLGVDVARQGDDDSVIYPRMGDDARTWPIRTFKNLRTTQLTNEIIKYIEEFANVGIKPSAIFVDGTGWGAGVYDQLFDAGYPAVFVQFGVKPFNQRQYRYMGDEMWGRMKDRIEHRLVLPGAEALHAAALKDQLTMREFGYTLNGDRINLVSKEVMKDDGLPSPDIADALALTFYREISEDMDAQDAIASQERTADAEYDPLEARVA